MIVWQHPSPIFRPANRPPLRRRNATPWEHIVSVSGGKDSTATYLLALERGMPFTAVFADTGHEHEATYDFVRALPAVTGGPDIKWVRADFSARIQHKRDVVQTKWVRDGVPDDMIRRALNVLHPTGNPFLDLCLWKGRFPSSKVRFCTEELKVGPIQQQVYAPLLKDGRRIISWQGVRADESRARALLPRWQALAATVDGQTSFRHLYAFRPIHAWSAGDVFGMHRMHGIAPNPLYSWGAGRVGCWPCIMCGKDELRVIAARDPEGIERVSEWERLVSEASKRGVSTFFAVVDDPLFRPGDVVRPATHGIRKRVEWSFTSRGGVQKSLMLDPRIEFGTACNQWGACE